MEAFTMITDWVTTGLTALVIFLAAIVHGITGFGFAQVSMGLLPLFRNPGAASIIFTVTAIFSNGRIWWSVRDDFDWRRWIVPVVGLALGLPLGVYGTVFYYSIGAVTRLATQV